MHRWHLCSWPNHVRERSERGKIASLQIAKVRGQTKRCVNAWLLQGVNTKLEYFLLKENKLHWNLANRHVALFHIMRIMIMLCYTAALAKTEPPRTLKLTFIEPGSEIIEIFFLLWSLDANHWSFPTFLVLVDGKLLQLIFAQAAPPSSVSILDKLGDLVEAQIEQNCQNQRKPHTDHVQVKSKNLKFTVHNTFIRPPVVKTRNCSKTR